MTPTDARHPTEASTEDLVAGGGRTPRQARLVKLGIGVLIGGALGLAYYLLVGCATGGCPITSNPFIATIYGAVVGAAVALPDRKER